MIKLQKQKAKKELEAARVTSSMVESNIVTKQQMKVNPFFFLMGKMVEGREGETVVRMLRHGGDVLSLFIAYCWEEGSLGRKLWAGPIWGF